MLTLIYYQLHRQFVVTIKIIGTQINFIKKSFSIDFESSYYCGKLLVPFCQVIFILIEKLLNSNIGFICQISAHRKASHRLKISKQLHKESTQDILSEQSIQLLLIIDVDFKIINQLMDHEQGHTQDSIQVLVRIKPGSDDESVIYTQNEIKLDKHSFAFDRIFPPSAEQQDIFVAVGKKLISHALEGYNSCIFVYGQTGSGKTYTMMGNNNGLMQRSFNQLFSRIDRMSNSECIVTCSYFQLYNEQIIDLLDRGKDKKSLNIRQDVRKGVFVENLTEESALNSDKLQDCLTNGMKNRHIGQTQMNRQSSRSHSIFTVSLAIKSQIDGKKVLKTPKLHFVDLAGSQRQKMTMATGDRLKQAGNINKSLTTLGMVINALASDKPKVHIPYRDSKLTCLLRDSLGGNSKTFIVATISTSILCFQETLSTLNFANRAKMVKVKALVNEQSLSTNLEQYKEEIRKLKQQILKLKTQKRVNFQNANESVISKNNADLEHKFDLITTKIEDLRSNMNNSSMESLIQKLHHKNNQEMIDQENNFDQMTEGNELLEYMASNHQLLSKINSTISEYVELKQEIKNIQFSKRMPSQQMKTPSKFQREQYQQLLMKRQHHIRELQEKIISLKQLNFAREVEIKQFKKKVMHSENNRFEQGGQLERLRQDLSESERKYGELRLKYEMNEDEKRTLRAQVNQMENRLRQSKQLYIYAQQKYENQKFIRGKLQNSLKQLAKKYQAFQSQKREQIQEWRSKMQQYEQKLLQAQRREDELRTEQQILNQTLQFNKRKIKEYNDKLQQANRQLHQHSLNHSKMAENITSLQLQSQRKTLQFSTVVNQLNTQVNDLKENNFILNENLTRVTTQKLSIVQQYSMAKQRHRSQIDSLYEKMREIQQQKITLGYQHQQLQALNKKAVYEFQIKIYGLQKNANILNIELESIRSWKQMMEEKYATQKQFWEQQKQRICEQNSNLRNDKINLKNQMEEQQKKYSDMEVFFSTHKNVIEDFQQMKKTYKQILVQNYKMKGEYSTYSTNNKVANHKELTDKVTYYQQKFRLMSAEYHNINDTAKKLKKKELDLLKKLQYYEESQKLKKMNSSNEADEFRAEKWDYLKMQNDELKSQISKLNSINESLMSNQKKEQYSKRMSLDNERYQLQQRQEKIRKNLQGAIKSWDCTKQNSCSNMSTQQLFNCWSKVIIQARRKIEQGFKAYKRQKSLKIHNQFILKENEYLKERVGRLQKDITMQALGHPRKLMKINEQLQSVPPVQ